ncbi:MAG: hypothetical protein M1819_001750 [Sarea resinae]|nr:MAG: hypothetical protein M1819_001750 [Sarea resinae]
MSAFLENLFNSIFTPGPTPTLLVATNVSFAALQGLLLILLIATYSVHFLALSFLCGGLWWSINWFVSELSAANEKEEEAKRLRGLRKSKEPPSTSLASPSTSTGPAAGEVNSGDDTETEVETAKAVQGVPTGSQRLDVGDEDEEGSLLRKRNSGDGSGEISTDSEWEKVDEEGEKGR